MHGLMMDMPLLISSLIKHAAQYHGDTEIVTRTVEGPIHRYTYAEAHSRARRLANALKGLGVQQGDRIGTLAWNTHRHYEVYFAVSGMGAVCHTINPRLFHDQLTYIINHARDVYLFVDATLVPLVEQLADEIREVRGVVVLTDEAHMPKSDVLPRLICYESLLDEQRDDFDWPLLDENTASSLCYTSGTTGNPKGVLYSHRSNVLHTFGAALPDSLNLSARDVVMPVVPMFHANAWGMPYVTTMTGAKQVLPGPQLDPASLHELIESEGVTFSAAVPTVWLMLLSWLNETGNRVDSMKSVVIGGSACPRAMMETFGEKYGVNVRHAWGMTEMSPLGTMNTPLLRHANLSKKEYYDLCENQGRPIFGVEMKITDDEGRELPRDGKAFGDLRVRGLWVAKSYLGGAGSSAFDEDGWFSTGDVATLDANGYMRITDRSKDVIKSGGEWISSIDLENLAVGHPGVAEAAVIGVKHPKWDERPLLLIVRRKDSKLDKAEILTYLQDKVARWWMPDDVVFVDELPHTATGKLLKTKLREDFADYVLPTA